LIPCGLLSGQQHFGGMYQLCLQSEYWGSRMFVTTYKTS
jgi:hypothetical protein